MAREHSMLRPYTLAVIIALGAGAAIPLLISLNPKLGPFGVFLGVLILAVIVIGTLKFPAALIVPVIFLPRVKDRPDLQFMQRYVDLTLLALIVLSVVIVINFLLGLQRPNGWSVRRLFAGLGKGVGTYFLFVGIVAASYLYSPAPESGWIKLTRFLIIGGLLFLSPLLLVKEEKDFRHFVITVLFAATFLAILTIAKLASGQPGVTDDIERLGPGWTVGMAVLLLLFYRVFENPHLRSLLMLSFMPCLVVGLLATGSRSSVVAVVVAIGATSFLLGQRRNLIRRSLIGLIILTLILTAGVVAFKQVRRVPEAADKYYTKWGEFEELLEGRRTQGSAGMRLGFYEAALRSVSERPAFGLGVGGWNVYYYGQDLIYLSGQYVATYPHNMVLEVAAEEGLLGLLALTAFVATVASAIKKIVRRDRTFVVLFSLLVFCVTCSMFSGDIDRNRLFWLWCGMTLAVFRMAELGLIKSPSPRHAEPRRRSTVPCL